MLETEANQRKKDTDFRCNKMEEEEVGHTFLLVKHMYTCTYLVKTYVN